LVGKVAKIILKNDVQTIEQALQVNTNGKTLNELLLESVAAIGENIHLRRLQVVQKTNEQTFGYYIHMGGKIAALTVVQGSDFDTAKDIAMQVTASSPKYLSQHFIAEEIITHEREVLTKEALNENEEALKPKPIEIIKKMIEGRLQKNLKEICLVNQPFIKNPDITVGEYVKAKGGVIASFERLAVGEGIEKKEDNFAEEVMSQVK